MDLRSSALTPSLPPDNPCARVRSSSLAWIQRHAEDVYIDRDALPALAQRLVHQSQIHWDEEGWHYDPSAAAATAGWAPAVRRERVALYILALDAVNFCFWPILPRYEYEDLACTLTAMASADHEVQALRPEKVSDSFALSAKSLCEMTNQSMEQLFLQYSKVSLAPSDMKTRCRLWNEIGTVLLDHFNGSAWSLIQSAEGSAVGLVRLLFEHFEGFRDCHGDLLFLKRAQICVGDWNAALQLGLPDLGELTTFADYRVPQLLRHFGALRYSESLARRVDGKEEIAHHSPEEDSIRAATVVAVEWLLEELRTLEPSRDWTAVETDWFLWQLGERMENDSKLLPHHRVRTIYY